MLELLLIMTEKIIDNVVGLFSIADSVEVIITSDRGCPLHN